MLRQRTGSLSSPLEAVPQLSDSQQPQSLRQTLARFLIDSQESLMSFPVSDVPIALPEYLGQLVLSTLLFLFPATVEMSQKSLGGNTRVLFVANHNIWCKDITSC